MGNIGKKIEIFENIGDMCFDAELKNQIIKIISLQSIRTPDVYKKIMDKDKFIDDAIKKLKEKPGYNIPDENLEKLKEKYSTDKNQRETFYTKERAEQVIKSWEEKLRDYFPNFSIIPCGSNYSFTLTDSHCYSVGSIFYVPFCPRYSLMLVPNKLKEQFHTTISDGTQVRKYLTCTEERAIDIFKDNMKESKYDRLFASRSFLRLLQDKKVI